MRRLILALGLAAAVVALVASPSTPATRTSECGLPETSPRWIEVAGGSWWKRVFGHPGITLALGSISKTGGSDVPTEARALGANTVYWDNYLNKRVGTPKAPADPAVVVERATKLVDYAIKVSGCQTPIMGENELFGAKLPTPWSATNSQYRANVLLFLQTLAAHGAHPYLAVSTVPNTVGDAGAWWLEVAKVADIVQEVYFPAPMIYKADVVHGNRILRVAFRRAIQRYADIGIPTSRLGLFVGFQTTKGFGGREGLEPASSWFRVTKWQALAARQVSRELHTGSVWSWGWGEWATRPEEYDPDKPAAACVYLWARDRSLCNGPKLAGKGFNASLTEGQIILPRGMLCRFGNALISDRARDALGDALGDPELAYTVLLWRAVLSAEAKLSAKEVEAAESRLVELGFGGDREAYQAALAEEKLTPQLARAIVTDELRQERVQSRMPVRRLLRAQLRGFYRSNAGLAARRVDVSPSAPWLGGQSTGVAVESYAPKTLFQLARGRTAVVPTLLASYKVTPLSSVKPLARFAFADAKSAIEGSIAQTRQEQAFKTWSAKAQKRAVYNGTCRLDRFPKTAQVDLPKLFRFFAAAGEQPRRA
jgi:hypothetical protein